MSSSGPGTVLAKLFRIQKSLAPEHRFDLSTPQQLGRTRDRDASSARVGWLRCHSEKPQPGMEPKTPPGAERRRGGEERGAWRHLRRRRLRRGPPAVEIAQLWLPIAIDFGPPWAAERYLPWNASRAMSHSEWVHPGALLEEAGQTPRNSLERLSFERNPVNGRPKLRLRPSCLCSGPVLCAGSHFWEPVP